MDSFQVTSPTIQFTGTTTINGQTPETQDHKNATSGYAGLDSNGDLVGTIILRQDTASNLSSVVLATGQEGYATDTGKLVVGDNATTFPNLAGWGGHNNTFTVYGNSFVGVGTSNSATGSGSVVLAGSNNSATGSQSVVVAGGANQATGLGAVVLNGGSNESHGQYTVTGGYHAIAAGAFSFAWNTNPSNSISHPQRNHGHGGRCGRHEQVRSRQHRALLQPYRGNGRHHKYAAADDRFDFLFN
jgi:hypothetical protein